ncbi:MAG: hypothetical protein Q9197_001587 [Variospora fuerteventurae]
MKLTALLLAFLPTLITAGCYTTGESWDRSLGPRAVDAACKELAGDYRGDQSKVQRLPQQNGQCYIFELKRIPSGSDAELLSITEDDCKDGMNKELFGCDRGGKSSYTNWTYNVFGSVDGRKLFAKEDFGPGGKYRYFALIQVDSPFENIVPIAYTGYPGDLRDSKTGEAGAHIYESYEPTAWSLAKNEWQMLEYKVDTYGGHSGSPVFRQGETIKKAIGIPKPGNGENHFANEASDAEGWIKIFKTAWKLATEGGDVSEADPSVEFGESGHLVGSMASIALQAGVAIQEAPGPLNCAAIIHRPVLGEAALAAVLKISP